MTTRRIYTAGSRRDHTPIHRSALLKVPEVTAMFWIVKILTTGMGEVFSDFLVQHLIPALAVLMGLLVFVVAVVRQLRAPRYLPWVYWFAVVMVSVFGTMAADVVHKGFGVPYLVSTVAFSIALAAIFVVWYRGEGTLSIHSIDSPRRERFYWAAVLATFALGTAAGDMTATTLHLGYLASGILFTIAIAIPWAAVGAPRAEPDRRLLGRLHPHAAARGVVRRLDGREPTTRRARLGYRAGQPCADPADRRVRGAAAGRRDAPRRPHARYGAGRRLRHRRGRLTPSRVLPVGTWASRRPRPRPGRLP